MMHSYENDPFFNMGKVTWQE